MATVVVGGGFWSSMRNNISKERGKCIQGIVIIDRSACTRPKGPDQLELITLGPPVSSVEVTDTADR